MAETITGHGLNLLNPFNVPSTDPSQPTKPHQLFPLSKSLIRRSSMSRFSRGSSFYQGHEGYGKSGTNRTSSLSLSRDVRASAWPTLMAVLVEHAEGQRDLITHKSIWHLSDQVIKNVYTIYIMFVCWGCCLFGSMKDPYYDSETYRKDGGDGTGHWAYDKVCSLPALWLRLPFSSSLFFSLDAFTGQLYNWGRQEDIEERARAELWREELIEEIEQKVGSLKELEQVTASTKE